MLFFSVINPAQPFADYLVSRLDRGSSLSFSTQNLKRSFFKEVVLEGFSVGLDEQTPLSSEALILDKGVGELLLSFFGKGETFTFTFVQPTVDISMAQVQGLGGGTSSTTPFLLSSWLERNSLALKTDSLNATFTSPTFSTSLLDADLSLFFTPSLELSSFTGTVARATAELGEAKMELQTIRVDIDSTLAVTAEASSGMVLVSGAETQFEQLALASHLESLSITQGKLGIDFSLAHLKIYHPQLQASIPNLSSRLTLEDFAFSTLEASYDKLDVSVAGFVVQAPTSTFNLKQDKSSLLLGFATKEGSPLTLTKEGLASILTDTMIGSAQWEESGQLYAKLSLRSIEAGIGRTSFALDHVLLSSEALLGPDGVDDISLLVESGASVAFPDAG
ncbi:MAG TPA: hypothetical protein VJ863_02530, partial [Sphaerochaeta sp.]|nr:hypothetical protein [Sphaerochaeta sp.]